MTIVEAITKVLEKEEKNLTSEEIYNGIQKGKLYTFGAKDPKAIVNGTIRRHSVGIDFSTASPIKYFIACPKREGKTTFKLKGKEEENTYSRRKLATRENETDRLPEEMIQISHEKHKKFVQDSLLEKVLSSDPVFFEHLVVDLLIKMGYGGSDPKSGIVTPTSNDGGIDGIINEDKLGLDKIYIQAKRYTPDNKIDRPKLQQFVGAMENVQKGVYITTSDFTQGAKEYVDKSQKNIRLISGDRLTELMVSYKVGICTVQTYDTYRIDLDYFSE